MRTLLSAATVALTLLPLGNMAHAATPDVTFELRPHCEDEDFADCDSFDVRDPLSTHTDELKVGDTLEMDLIMHNPSAHPVKRFRAWISYESSVLEGVEIEASDVFPDVTPGELDFDADENYIKLSGSSDAAITDEEIVLARISLIVTDAPLTVSILSFYDASADNESHTSAFIDAGNDEENVASVAQSSVIVRLIPETMPSSAASSLSSAMSSALSSDASVASSSTAALPAIFSKLQVQGLRVTTEGSSVFLAWTPLPSAEIAGYNLYYGAVSGRYLQRRSVDGTAQTITIRALPVGTTYYFAVRGVNAAGEESDFSREVAVSVGNPATSTSPLSGSFVGGPNGNTPGTSGAIAGDSGPGTWILALVLISACMGTFLAARRQWHVSSAYTK